MISDRRAATIVGVLFLTVMVSWTLGFVLLGNVLDNIDYLTNTHLKKHMVFFGVLFELIDIAAIVGIMVIMFPIIKLYSERTCRCFCTSINWDYTSLDTK